jgi:hypothetical protein
MSLSKRKKLVMAIIRNPNRETVPEAVVVEVRPRQLVMERRLETVLVDDEANGAVKLERRNLQVIKNRKAAVQENARGRKIRNRGQSVINLSALATEIPLDELVPTIELLMARARELEAEGEVVDFRTT